MDNESDICKKCQKYPIYAGDYFARENGFCIDCWKIVNTPFNCKICKTSSYSSTLTFDNTFIKQRGICNRCFVKPGRQSVSAWESDITTKEIEIEELEELLEQFPKKSFFNKFKKAKEITFEQQQKQEKLTNELEFRKKELGQLQNMKERRARLKITKVNGDIEYYDNLAEEKIDSTNWSYLQRSRSDGTDWTKKKIFYWNGKHKEWDEGLKHNWESFYNPDDKSSKGWKVERKDDD